MTRRSAAAMAATLAAAAACSSAPYDYSAYLAHMPKSILVLPPINDSIEAGASNKFLATVTRPIAERGYYVFPIAVVEHLMRQNGRPTPTDMHATPLDKLREVFAADAVLYIHIKEWGTSYQVITSRSCVVTECRLVDLATGNVLWAGVGQCVRSSGGGSAIGALANAVASQVASSIDDPCPDLAREANRNLFDDGHHGLLLGWRHPDFEEDQVRRRADGGH